MKLQEGALISFRRLFRAVVKVIQLIHSDRRYWLQAFILNSYLYTELEKLQLLLYYIDLSFQFFLGADAVKTSESSEFLCIKCSVKFGTKTWTDSPVRIFKDSFWEKLQFEEHLEYTLQNIYSKNCTYFESDFEKFVKIEVYN